MKNLSGIDLSELTQAQRKMCVKLLALNNVQFEQSNNTYTATLRVPTNQINNYINGRKNEVKQIQSKSIKKQGYNKQNEKDKQIRQKIIAKQKSVGKQPEKGKSSMKKLNQVKKQPSKTTLSKKPLFKTVKLPQIERIQKLYPDIQIYIYPKRLNLLALQQQIQQIYQHFWQLTKQGNNSQADFQKCFIQNICPYNPSNSKSKNDQNIVNILESVNYTQHREIGVKIFYLFLSQQYSKQILSYFLVIRALIEELIGQKIINIKNKQKNLTQNMLSNSNLTTSLANKTKMKWNPFQKQLTQFVVQNFLKVVIPNNNTTNIDNLFEQLTQKMYFCEIKKGNYIYFYDLIDFMLKRFNQECQDITITNLQLSYSNNDSTLNEIVAQSANKSSDRPLQTNFQLSLMPESELNFQSFQPNKQQFKNDRILTQKAIEKAKQMCKKIQVIKQNQEIIIQKVTQCIQSIINMDKIKWVEAMEIQGSEQEVNFIQQIQIYYKKICQDGLKLTMVNNLVKKIFVGPGFIKLFSRYIDF